MPEVDIEGQQRLLDARVLLIGLGGLGSPIAIYLAAAGVGNLHLADIDRVDLSNLQRQILYRNGDIGQSKAETAKRDLIQRNPDCQIDTIDTPFSELTLSEYIGKHQIDLVIDATDNFATRFMINRASVTCRVPLVSGAAIRMQGQVGIFNEVPGNSPCYQCLYSDTGADEDLRCSENGVLAPVVGMIGTVQATEALKLLMGIGEPLSGRLLILDALRMQWREIALPRDPGCPVCGRK